MTVISNFDHWLFVASNGAFTSGRQDVEGSLFPYKTADYFMRNADESGALTILLVFVNDAWKLWEPWRDSGRVYRTQRNLYKHICGTKLIFEEINYDLGLRFSWSLSTSESYGLVRECSLENLNEQSCEIRYLDGFHRLLPAHIPQKLFGQFSYLSEAYMHHEVVADTTLAIYTLNSRISDHTEPAESLRASCAWSSGHADPVILLSESQVERFRRGEKVEGDSECRAKMGAYLAVSQVELFSHDEHHWMTVADTGCDHAALIKLVEELSDSESLAQAAQQEVCDNTHALRRRIAAADGLQYTSDSAVSVHHFSNVLFNVMRGGIFADNYRFPCGDFISFLKFRNTAVSVLHERWLAGLPKVMDLITLREAAKTVGDPDLKRLANEYLPLTFSRRHGDPSRPWNQFAINLRDDAGNPVYFYEGNWRDIFQNWEALAQSYPEALSSMLAVFLNASTAEGYNPYRITRNGIDWEVIDPTDPWSNIGYRW